MMSARVKRLSVKTKFLLLIIPALIISFITIYLLEADIYVLSVVLLSYLVVISSGIYIISSEISAKAGLFAEHSERMSLDAENQVSKNYEEKIEEFNKVYLELLGMENVIGSNREMETVFKSICTVSERILDELNTAKIYKVRRNEFLGNVAHELRTPIFAVQLSLETLADGAVNDASVNMDFINKALNQTYRLKELVDDLISISRLETGMKLSKRYFTINSLISDTVSLLQHVADNKGITLKFNPGVDDGQTVFGDSERIKQVLLNLIENSVKYTQKGGVYVTVRKDDKSVAVIIEDTGVGIPEEDLPRIFERFYRVDKNRSRDMGGSGLGLSIVKHILELHNSPIKVESELNKGSRFEFRLPV